nr:hypothetical protein [Bacteroidota bacterium]
QEHIPGLRAAVQAQRIIKKEAPEPGQTLRQPDQERLLIEIIQVLQEDQKINLKGHILPPKGVQVLHQAEVQVHLLPEVIPNPVPVVKVIHHLILPTEAPPPPPDPIPVPVEVAVAEIVRDLILHQVEVQVQVPEVHHLAQVVQEVQVVRRLQGVVLQTDDN